MIQGLPKDIQSRLQPENTHADAHGRETLPMLLLFAPFCRQQHSSQARTV